MKSELESIRTQLKEILSLMNKAEIAPAQSCEAPPRVNKNKKDIRKKWWATNASMRSLNPSQYLNWKKSVRD